MILWADASASLYFPQTLQLTFEQRKQEYAQTPLGDLLYYFPDLKMFMQKYMLLSFL